MATSIGKLNVLISASTDQFDKAIKSAEKTMAGFVSKATAPIGGITGALAGLGGIGALAAGGFINPIANLAKMLPGGELTATSLGLANLDKSIEHTVERVKELTHNSEKLGVAPKFLRALQIAAGPEADNVAGMMGKFEKFLGQLRVGQDDLGRSTGGLSEKMRRFVDIQKLLNAPGVEGKLRVAADAFREIQDPIDRATFLMTAFGKAGLGMGRAMSGGSEGFDKALEKVEKFGLAESGGMRSAMAIAAMQKEMKLLKEGAELKATSGVGLLSQAADLQWQTGSAANWFGYKTLEWANWLSGGGIGRGPVEALRKKYERAGFQDAKEHQIDLENKHTQAIEKMIDALQKQSDLVGLTAEQQARYNVALAGGNAEAQDRAGAIAREFDIKQKKFALDKQLEEMERANRFAGRPGVEAMVDKLRKEGIDEGRIGKFAQLALAAEGGNINLATKTPIERFIENIDRARALGGNVTDKTLDRLIAGGLDQALGLGGLIKRSTGAARYIGAGSQEEFALLDAARGKAEENKVKVSVDLLRDIAKEQLKAEQEARDRMKDVLDEIRNRGPAAVLDFPR